MRIEAPQIDLGCSLPSLAGRIGNTPLIALPKLSAALQRRILGKAEFLNPGGSVKDRPALNMIVEGEKSGALTCDDDKTKPGEMLYKAGTKAEQHIVSVQPADAGASGAIYNLVYVSTKGLDDKK